ncbi:MAG: GTPase ObgE [Oscillospiraceae bacterium]|jgi:GTP-binding protein|nr:GTPase ObgE [Oscillospiraceae bacterium]
MFVDIVNINVKAGNGGNGCVSFHRDKYTAYGGPDGGNGGKGGNIIFKGDHNLSTLADFRYKKKFAAQNGKNGEAGKKTGKSGDDLLIKVPVGTLVKHENTGKIMFDISNTDEYIIAEGGRGGLGNMNFANSVRQSPRFSKSGIQGEEFEIKLELKLLADVGIIGFPNVGKSTFISMVSNAKPEIANYHFTTITPKLGVVKYSYDYSFVLADIPGLIEGAWKGLGLGHNFLRHTERCRLLLHVVDVSGSEGRNPVNDFEIINNELKKFNPKLCDLPMIVAGNKCDIAQDKQISAFGKYIKSKGYDFFSISIVDKKSISKLLDKIAQTLSGLPSCVNFLSDEDFYSKYEPDNDILKITKIDGKYVVKSNKFERLINSVNLEDYDSLKYFQSMISKWGLNDALKEQGIQDGDTVQIGSAELDFFN